MSAFHSSSDDANLQEPYDVVVVGGGMVGAAIAASLGESPPASSASRGTFFLRRKGDVGRHTQAVVASHARDNEKAGSH